MSGLAQQQVPEGYKQTEVGVIPEDWEVKSIGSFCSCYSGGTPRTGNSAFYGGDLSWITSGDLNKGRIRKVNGRITKAGFENSSAKKVKKDTLLFALYGATAGVTAITEIDATINQAVLAIILNEKNDVGFLFQYLQLKKGYLIDTYTQGGQPNFSGDIVKSFLVSLPPTKKEQTAIASALADVDKLIISLEKLIAKKRAIKTAAMQQLLTGKKRLPPFGTLNTKDGKPVYKQTELGEIPEDWEVKPIGSFCSCFSGGTPRTGNASFYGGAIPWITSGDLNKGRIRSVDGRITKQGLDNSSAKEVKKNTLLFALYGATAGVAAITEIDATINQAILAIILDRKNNMGFLFQYLQLNKNYLIDTYTQGGQPNFSGDIVNSFLVSLPSDLDEQKAISEVLSDMDDEIDILENRLRKTKQLKQGMMQELLTGRTRLV